MSLWSWRGVSWCLCEGCPRHRLKVSKPGNDVTWRFHKPTFGLEHLTAEINNKNDVAYLAVEISSQFASLMSSQALHCRMAELLSAGPKRFQDHRLAQQHFHVAPCLPNKEVLKVAMFPDDMPCILYLPTRTLVPAILWVVSRAPHLELAVLGTYR